MVRVMIFSSKASSSSLEGAAVSWKTGYRPGTLGDRGFSPESLAKLRPGIVFVSLCAFSHVGPWASRRGFDTVVQTVSGITSRQGELFPGTSPGPQFYPVSAIDYLTGYLMAFGAMVALARRAQGRQLACADLARSDRALARRTRPGAGGRAEGRAEGIHARGAGPLVDGERYPGRSAAPSRAGGAPLRNAAALGATDRAARIPRAGVAGAGHVTAQVSSDDRDANARPRRRRHAVADLPNGLFDNCKIAVLTLGICLIEPDADN